MPLISRRKTERRAWSADPVSCVGHQADISSPTPLGNLEDTLRVKESSGTNQSKSSSEKAKAEQF